MAWDVERTKRLLLDAATAEFSEHGLAGARVDRIAAAARVNKEPIYQYFRKKDEHFGRACRFLDPKARRCTIYKARPTICRQFPAERRCGYYDFLMFERKHQNDPDLVATTENGLWK